MNLHSNTMTDLEISKTLALAIGWTEKDMCVEGAGHFSQYAGERHLRINFTSDINAIMTRHWQKVFDYRDWAVIGPIAARFECFPQIVGDDSVGKAWRCDEADEADTPQKAIALAVLGGMG